MPTSRVVIIGAGVGGLAAAIDLARAGCAVTVVEKAAVPGGKVRVDGPGVDAGPTVLTMRWVFDALFEDAGTSLDSYIALHASQLLARHAWSGSERLDLFADIDRSVDAIGGFAGRSDAEGYRAFCARAQRVYQTLEGPFIRSQRPTALSLAARTSVAQMFGISPFSTLWKALGEHFRDPRLRQLFGRYSTYSGSSPFDAPATLMLIAHVEQQGVWLPQGGMVRLAQAMAELAAHKGAVVRTGTTVAEISMARGRAAGVVLANGERIEAEAVICNADAAALAMGAFGRGAMGATPNPKPIRRSLSAVTWAVSAVATGFPLARHNVFFSRRYQAEFDAIFRHGRLPGEPTVYVCAQDRDDAGPQTIGAAERLLILVNAPPNGDRREFPTSEIEQCATSTFSHLERCGLTLRDRIGPVTTPADFGRMFPATGGALYGQAVHGSMAAFKRPGSRSAVPGLYLAGGSVHPGPGIPMATLSGRLAAESLLQDLTSR